MILTMKNPSEATLIIRTTIVESSKWLDNQQKPIKFQSIEQWWFDGDLLLGIAVMSPNVKNIYFVIHNSPNNPPLETVKTDWISDAVTQELHVIKIKDLNDHSIKEELERQGLNGAIEMAENSTVKLPIWIPDCQDYRINWASSWPPQRRWK